MERFAATILFLFALLSGGGAAAASDGCESPMRGAANQLAAAAACTTHSATGGVTALAGPTCDAPLIASQLTKLCSVELDAPGALCCTVVLMTVEQDTDCLCWVADEPEFDLSDLSVAKVWGWYKSCGGRRRSAPRNTNRCEPGSSPPPPPPPAKPEAPSAWPLRLWLAVWLLSAAAVGAIIFGALKLWLPRTVQVTPRMQGHDQGAKLNLGQDQDAAMTGEPPVTSGQGDVRPRADETAANAIATGQKISGSGEEEASPRPSPVRVEGRSQLARARLPSPPPFEPPPPPVLPPAVTV